MPSPTSLAALRRAVVAATFIVAVSAPVGAVDPASPAPSGVVEPSAAASPGLPIPGVPHDAPDLEALLPTTVDGSQLFTISLGPATWQLLGSSGLGALGMGPLGAMLDELGIEAEALEMAFANDPLADPLYNLFVIRVAGVPGSAVAEAYGRLAQQTEIDSSVCRTTVGGIPVSVLDAPFNPVGDVWFYGVDSVMFGVQAADEATAAKLLALLPTEVPGPSADPSASEGPAASPVASPIASPVACPAPSPAESPAASG